MKKGEKIQATLALARKFGLSVTEGTGGRLMYRNDRTGYGPAEIRRVGINGVNKLILPDAEVEVTPTELEVLVEMFVRETTARKRGSESIKTDPSVPSLEQATQLTGLAREELLNELAARVAELQSKNASGAEALGEEQLDI